ncbi:MAG: septal ring lytic transglycosylase RlpA family protein [Acidobacteriota bacterium]
MSSAVRFVVIQQSPQRSSRRSESPQGHQQSGTWLPLAALLALLLLPAVGCSSNLAPSSAGDLANVTTVGEDDLPTEVTSAPRGQRIERGIASWYGPGFHGKRTANGEVYDMEAMTAAHKTLPFDTWVEVVNLDNGLSTRLRINDRGPFIRGRVIDLSKAGARVLGVIGPGIANVELYLVAPYPSASDGGSNPSGGSADSGSNPGPRGAYTVQLGAFRDRDRADALRRQLIRRFPATVVESGQDGLYRVRIGAYPYRADAEALLREVRGEGFEASLARLAPSAP